MHDRYYLWQDNPSWPIYIRDLERLTLQVGRQIGGVLIEGHESFKTLWGLPASRVCGPSQDGCILSADALVDSHWRLDRRCSSCRGSAAIMGAILSLTRFTNYFTPLILVGMSGLAAGVWAWMRRWVKHPILARTTTWFTAALLVALSLWPLGSLFRYYDRAVSLGDTNARHYAFFDEFIRQWRGEKIFVERKRQIHRGQPA